MELFQLVRKRKEGLAPLPINTIPIISAHTAGFFYGAIFSGKKKTATGFTLIEVLLYVGISGSILLTISVLFAAMLQARADYEAVAEVEGQGTAAMQVMTQTIRNALKITSPATSTSSSTLSINTPTSTNNPTIFDISTGTIRMREGGVSTTSLTTTRILVSNLIFQNLSRSNTTGTVRIQFTAQYNSSSTVSRATYQKTFISSASLR